MRRNGFRSLLIVAVASAAFAAACGGQASAPSAPGSPSAVSAASPPPAGAASGATISGTVVGVSTASALSPQRVSLTVSVTGTSVASSVDDNGRFTLTNVPAGHVDLHFSGSGVDAHLVLDGVPEHATIEITVRVSGTEARLENQQAGGDKRPDNDDNDDAEVKGSIVAGTVSGSCGAHNLAFTVGTTRVVTNGSTLFKDGTCDSLKAGTVVEVKGKRQGDGSLLAASVEGDSEAEDDEAREAEKPGLVEVKGTIAQGSLGGSCAANTLSFKVGTTLVKTNMATQFKDTSCGSLKAGDAVEVRGARQADASVLAARVERKK